MFGNYYNVPKKELAKRIKNIVKRFDMEKFQHQRIDTLSTGQYQSVFYIRHIIWKKLKIFAIR